MNASAIQREYARSRKPWVLLERLLGIVGGLLLGIYCCAQLSAFVLSRAALYAIDSYLTAPTENVEQAGREQVDNDTNFSLWANARVRAYRAVSTLKLDPAIAVLTIPRLKLTAPVFEGTEETALDRGVGRIAGTAALGTSGNIGIAGHRDGFFRVLKDIQPGDLIQIRTPRHEEIYTVTTSKVVDRRDVNVLHPTSLPNLTLVTCYPFYFVGAAPERFIVKAVLKQQIPQTSMSHSAKKSADFPRHYRGIY